MSAGAVLFVGAVVAITLFDPLSRAVSGVAIDGATIQGTRVTMTNPRLSGYEKDGRPYHIEASRAVQDVKAPTLFELHDLKARLTMQDRSVTRFTAGIGNYDSTAETMALSGGAHVVGDTGLDAVLDEAIVAFKSNTLTTSRPVTVAMPGKRITADAMTIAEGGKHVSFDGHVHTDIDPDQAAPAAAAAPSPAP